VAVVRSRMASSRARLKSRMASSSTAGTSTGVRSPERINPGQWDGVTTVGFDAVARLFGHAGGRDDPAARPLFRQLPLEPGATGTRFIDKDQLCGLGLARAGEVVTVTLARANGPEVGHLGAVILRDVSHGHRVFGDIHPDVKRARLAHG
jgi:hypothetical protein